MSLKDKKIRIGLRPKLFLLVLIGFSLLLSAMYWRIDVIAHRVANDAIRQTLEQSQISLQTKLQSRFDNIAETAKNFSRDGRLLPLIYENDSLTLQDVSTEFEQSLDFYSLTFTNARGEILARTDRPEAIGHSVAGRSFLFDQALSGIQSQGVIVSQGNLLQIVAIPIQDNFAKDVIRGSVAVAYELSPKIADEIHALTQSDVAFYRFSRDKNREINGVALTYSSNPDLTSSLEHYFAQNENTWQALTQANTMIDSLVLDLNQHQYLSALQALKNSEGGHLGFVIMLNSKTKLMAPFVEIQQQLLIVGIICLAIASLMAAFIASNISKPIINLVKVSEKIQQGEYPDSSGVKILNNEVGILQESIFQMGKNLKDKADLENYLADLSENLEDDSFILDAQNIENNLNMNTLTAASNATINNPQPLINEAGSEHIKNIQDTLNNQTVVNENVHLEVSNTSNNMVPPAHILPSGTTINNRYIISSLIGSGAMAEVYLANDTALKELIALKLISQQRMQVIGINNLTDEIRLARKITHRNILRTFDFGQYNDDFYITMEFIHGFSLESLIEQKGRLDRHIGVIMCKQIALAIGAAHEQGIIHRDLKPANMMINKQGILKIMDFGLARTLNNGSVTEKEVSGTPRFMAPEQFTGKALDQRTDIYAVGVIMYAIFTGDTPYHAKTFIEWAQAHANEEIPRASKIQPSIPKAIDNIIFKALQKEKEQRYNNIKELLVDLELLA